MEDKSNHLVWVDLEMTGLDVTKDIIMEIAVLVTDGNLENLVEGPCFEIKVEKEILDGMGEWCKKTHGESGLTQKCLDSTVTIQEAEKKVLEFLTAQGLQKGKPLLAGNSIHMDRMFILKEMPEFLNFLHYRILDVTTTKELCRRWYPQALENVPKKSFTHRALEDILASIEELKYYKKTIFK